MMSMHMYRVGIIVRPKKTDALICQSLAKHFKLEIAQYGVPQTDWIRWIWKRLQTAGFLTLLGHLELSLYIKWLQFFEGLTGKTVWEEHGIPSPQWTGLDKKVCQDERSLGESFKGVDFVIALDAFRLSQTFFRDLHIPYFEIAWGDATKYLGDSAAFWEYTMGNRKASTVSIIERTAYFQKVTVLSQIPINSVTANETLRSLKVKQAIELSIQLPAVLKGVFLNLNEMHGAIEERKIIKQCYAPTLMTYAKYRLRGLRSLPRYACRSKEIFLKKPKANV